ncbi:acyl carrier protein [Amycolatopsis aidingensis]|uniref:acyl carrier protein n=1 Tax=Amycolatopsis aidingensis TaxID=2842453 RepID=UPI001C0CB0FD|nr:acyl carrier protein [Amycolatopsis aidingensis]
MEQNRNTGVTVDSDGDSDLAEKAVVTALQAVLGVSEVPWESRFGVLGGDSLRAVRILSWLWRELDVELPVHALQPHTTVAELADTVREHVEAAQA